MKRFIIQSEILDNLAHSLTSFKKHSRQFGLFLTIGASIYIGVILIFGWEQLLKINWNLYMRSIPSILGIYLFSIILQMCVWLLILREHKQLSLFDLLIYSRTILWRQLPGGIWHWAGRASSYQLENHIPEKIILTGNLIEWLILLINAIGAYGIWGTSLPIWGRLGLITISYMLTMFISTLWYRTKPIWQKLFLGIIWSFLYQASWSTGGIILYLLVINTSKITPVTLIDMNMVWTLAGGISAIAIIAPAGLGIREFSLAYFLSPYLTITNAVIIAILIRFLFIGADLLWGTSGTVICHYFIRKYQTLPQSPP